MHVDASKVAYMSFSFSPHCQLQIVWTFFFHIAHPSDVPSGNNIKSCKFCGRSQQLPLSVSLYVNVNVKAFFLWNSRFSPFRWCISPLYWRTCLSGSNKGFIILTVSSKPADLGRLQAPPCLSNCSSGPWRCEKIKVGQFLSTLICIKDSKNKFKVHDLTIVAFHETKLQTYICSRKQLWSSQSNIQT